MYSSSNFHLFFVYHLLSRHCSGVRGQVSAASGLVCSAVNHIPFYRPSVTHNIGTAALLGVMYLQCNLPAAAWYCVRASANWPAASSFLPFSRYDSTDMELAEQWKSVIHSDTDNDHIPITAI